MTDVSGTVEWRAPEVERAQPSRAQGERQGLEDFLDYGRATLLAKCTGLTAAQLRERAVPPSALSLLGLVRHMSEVERWWFRRHAGGEEIASVYGEGPEDFDEVEHADAAADFATYLGEVESSRAAVRGKDLDAIVQSRGHHPERSFDIRWIYLHMIEEYARHNGHADLLRECIDGSTGE